MITTRRLLLGASLALVVAACGSGAGARGASAAPSATPSPTAPAASPTAVPGASGSNDGSVVDPGGSGGGNDPGGGAVDPTQPKLVLPVAGAHDVHPVRVEAITPAVDGRHVTVRVAWWSGVEPCNVLAAVDTVRDGTTFTITVREGSVAAPDTMCIEIAEHKAAVVDLGELEPGTWTIAPFGDAPPVEVVVA